ERGRRVALKTLKRVDAAGIYRFKQEFRALAGVSHPNLAVLHELVSAGDAWFLTMELLEGKTFLEHVRGPQRADDEDEREVDDSEITERVGRELPRSAVEIATLRDSLRQLCLGVSALQ